MSWFGKTGKEIVDEAFTVRDKFPEGAERDKTILDWNEENKKYFEPVRKFLRASYIKLHKKKIDRMQTIDQEIEKLLEDIKSKNSLIKNKFIFVKKYGWPDEEDVNNG